ncbi:hypothetical protein, partial [Cupriavidus sp. L7L]|uniref:hypothetical protein n=1 Tax=Cupriavidus sp. L7L TaxID=2546443 RepID=UPI001A9E63C9
AAIRWRGGSVPVPLSALVSTADGHVEPRLSRSCLTMPDSKLIEQGFGWVKTVGRMRQVMVRGLKRVDQILS